MEIISNIAFRAEKIVREYEIDLLDSFLEEIEEYEQQDKLDLSKTKYTVLHARAVALRILFDLGEII